MQSFPSLLYSVTFKLCSPGRWQSKAALTKKPEFRCSWNSLISSLVYQDLFTCQIYIESEGLFFLSSVALLPPYIHLHYRPHMARGINKQGIRTASSDRALVIVCVSAHKAHTGSNALRLVKITPLVHP